MLVNSIFQDVVSKLQFQACVQDVTQILNTCDKVVQSASVTFFVVQLDQVIGQTLFIIVATWESKADCVQALLDIHVATSSHVNTSVSLAIKFTIAVLNAFDQAINHARALIEAVCSRQFATSSQFKSQIRLLINVVSSHITAGFQEIQSATSSQLHAQDKSPTRSNIACCTFTLLIIAVTISPAISVHTPQYVRGELQQQAVAFVHEVHVQQELQVII